MKILIWPGHHDWLDATIKFCTHGKGSHAAFLRADGFTVHEAFYPCVHDRPLTLNDRKAVEVFELEGVTHEEHAAFELFFNDSVNKGVEYSIVDLVRYALNRPVADERHTFCSRYVLYGCKTVLPLSKMPLVRLPMGDWGAPRDLRISPRLHLIPNYWRN